MKEKAALASDARATEARWSWSRLLAREVLESSSRRTHRERDARAEPDRSSSSAVADLAAGRKRTSWDDGAPFPLLADFEYVVVTWVSGSRAFL